MEQKQISKDTKYARLSRVAWIQFFFVTLVIGILWFSFGQIVASNSTTTESAHNQGVSSEGKPNEAKTIAPKPRPFAFLTGTYGDTFGVLTALFTGLALAGLWYTIQLQRIELAATRDELRSQAESLRKQAFEGTFFQLLRKFSEVTSEVEHNPGPLRSASDPVIHGKEAIRAYCLSLKRLYASVRSDNEVDNRAKYSGLASKLFVTHADQLSHYFQTLECVFDFINSGDLTQSMRHRYASIVRAQLSTYELAIIFHYCANKGESCLLKTAVETYSLLLHLPTSVLPAENFAAPFVFFADSAYGKIGNPATL